MRRPLRLCPPLLRKTEREVQIMTHERIGGRFRKRIASGGCGVEGHSGTRDSEKPFLAWPASVRRLKKCQEKEGQSGDSATKQSVTLCAVVHPFHASSPSHSLPPFFPLSNWCPQSCVSPHLPALKLHQPYLLLSLSMIIIIIIVIIVVIMVRIAVIACYF